MTIDISKLENVLHKEDKMTARCPACKEIGHDNKGNHLIVYNNGAFECIMNTDKKDPNHRKIILKYVGDND